MIGTRRTRPLYGMFLTAAFWTAPIFAAERELDEGPPPDSALEIETPIERVFPLIRKRAPLIPRLREQIDQLPPFFADSRVEARFRTYYRRNRRISRDLSEAWAVGGSLSYRSGWFEDFLQAEIEGFTSQPVVAPNDRDGTLLLAERQKGYSVLGIANAKLRYKGLVLTGFRQYLDLPYVNRSDSRMTPNTFESITLAKPDGKVRFSTGYTWKIKQRTSEDFVSMTEAIGLRQKRGLAHVGVVWDPGDTFHAGSVVGVIPDLAMGIYGELGFGRELANGWEARLDTQFTYMDDIGKDLMGDALDRGWNLGIRASTSRAGAVLRLGFSITSPDAAINAFFGSSPSYVDLMQRTFNRADSKAILMSASYDFSKLGLDGLTAIVNFVASFDGKLEGVHGDAQEVDLTIDYRIGKGLLKRLWLRVRGSWLSDENANHDGSDIRVILRYDFPVI